MSAVIGILLAILAIFVLIKVAAFILKVIAVIVLVGIAVAAYFYINRKPGGRG